MTAGVVASAVIWDRSIRTLCRWREITKLGLVTGLVLTVY